MILALALRSILPVNINHLQEKYIIKGDAVTGFDENRNILKEEGQPV